MYKQGGQKLVSCQVPRPTILSQNGNEIIRNPQHLVSNPYGQVPLLTRGTGNLTSNHPIKRAILNESRGNSKKNYAGASCSACPQDTTCSTTYPGLCGNLSLSLSTIQIIIIVPIIIIIIVILVIKITHLHCHLSSLKQCCR